MSQKEQEDIPSEDALSSPEWPGPDGAELSGIPPSEFLFTYLQQRADSLSITQSDLETLLTTEAKLWILTVATDQGREIIAEAPIWNVNTLGEIRSRHVLLLRVRELPPYYRPIPPSTNGDDTLSIVSAAIVRFSRKQIEKMRQQAYPLLITEVNDTHALAVFYDDRYHTANDTAVSGHLLKDLGSNRPVGTWLNEATERIVVHKSTGTIIDYSLKDEETLLAVADGNLSGSSSISYILAQRNQIGIGLATGALAMLLMTNVATVSLNDPIANGIGLAAFGVLIGTMLLGDLTDG